MLCDQCGKNEANVHIETNVNGVAKQENLCAECAKGHVQQGLDFGNFLSGMMPVSETKKAQCSNCGMTISDFERRGKFGCATCYSDLRKEIQPVLKRIHGSTQYSGYQQTESDKVRLAIQEHKAKLSEAILHEDYEEAAALRDKIKLLEEGNDQVD